MLAPLILLSVFWQTPPQTMLGADEVMRRIAAVRPKPKAADLFDELRGESRALTQRLDKLSPVQAAEQWLKLMQGWEVVAAQIPSYDSSTPDHWQEVMMPSLPQPAAWPLIRDRLAKLAQSAKHRAAIALFDDLLGKDADVVRYLESKRKPDADPAKEDVFSSEHDISEAELSIALRNGDFPLLSKTYVRMVKGMTFPFSDGFPDIVGQVGLQRARPLVQQMLEASRDTFYKFNGTETQNLCRSIVLSDLPKLKVPQWALARGTDDYPFVAAQVARFGESDFKNRQSGEDAELIYALGLAKSGQLDHARQLLSTTEPTYIDFGRFVKPTDEQWLFALISKLLDPQPPEVLWPLYTRLAQSLARTEEVKRRVDGLLENPGQSAQSRATYRGWRAELESTNGQLKAAVDDTIAGFEVTPKDFATRLITLSKMTGDHRILDLVYDHAAEMGTAGSQLDYYGAYLQQGRISAAQTFAIKSAQDVNNVNLSAEGQGRLLNALPNVALELAELYYQTNQPDQVIALLREYPKLGAGDLAEIVAYRKDNFYREGLWGKPVGFYAAWALANTGQKALAIRVLHQLLARDCLSDDALELLNTLDGPSAVAEYNKIIAARPMEPRFQMWKGDLLFRAGRLKEAEKCVRSAIALDPVDSTAIEGKRQTAYEILARILKAQGKNSQAGACQKVVKAARIEERGRKLQQADLLTEACALYRQALRINPKDYLAQMSYSRALADLGKDREATAAYLSSLKLIPISLGPVTELYPLTFGIEIDKHYFDLTRSSLSELIQSHPRNPGVRYALGLLSSRLGDRKAALNSFEAAVKIDPNYQQAWKEIAFLSDNGSATKGQIEAAGLAMIKLDPLDWLNYFTSRTFTFFGEKSSLWLAYHATSASHLPIVRDPLFTLEASKRSMAAGSRPLESWFDRDSPDRPGTKLARLPELKALFP